MNNHEGTTLTRPTGTTFSRDHNSSIKLPWGKDYLGYSRPYYWGVSESTEIILKMISAPLSNVAKEALSGKL